MGANEQNFNYRYSPHRPVAVPPYSIYGSVEVTVSGGVTNFSMASETALFHKVSTANDILIRVYGATAKIRFNSAANDIITVEAGGQLAFGNLEIQDVFITTQSGAAEVKITTCGWK
jgi:hypothetical protein